MYFVSACVSGLLFPFSLAVTLISCISRPRIMLFSIADIIHEASDSTDHFYNVIKDLSDGYFDHSSYFVIHGASPMSHEIFRVTD